MAPTIAYISHQNLSHNIELIRRVVGSRKIMAVVKAFAYGHGDIEISRTALESGCEYLGVALIEEGIKLRKAGITEPILLFGAHLPEFLSTALENNLEITITSDEQVDYLDRLYSKKRKKIPVHIKIDTGMNRVGFPFNLFEDCFKKIMKNTLFDIKGVYSHLSTADETDQSYIDLQIKRFQDVKKYIQAKCDDEIIFHLANSAAIMKLPHTYYDMVRPGIMLYGQPPSPDFPLEWDLKEVMSLHSRLVLIKFLRKNEPISYGRRFYTRKDTYIGVIPIGYADGFNRKLTNKAEIIIRGKKYPVVGTICMDMVMVDLGNHFQCKTGDDVIIYGQMDNQCISIREISKKLKTIPYEITCGVSARVPRIHLFS
jgi:alanine racemase